MNQVERKFNFQLSQQEIFLLENHYKSCPKHPDSWLTSLSTDPNSTQFLQCAFCLSENPHQYTIPLIGLIQPNEKIIFKNWPVQGNQQLYEKLLCISKTESSVEELQTKIKDFFLNFRKEIDQKLNDKEIQMLATAKSLWNFNEQVIIQYNQFAEKGELKKIILNQKDDFVKQNLLFGETISRIYNNQTRYQQALQDSIDHFETQSRMINFDTPHQIRENILSLLNNIDMFVIKNFEDIRINKFQQNIDLYNNNLNQTKPSEMTTSQLIVKLINNKFNSCSQELSNQLKIIIAKVSGFLDAQNITNYINEDILKIDLDKFTDQQLDVIKNVSESIAEVERSENTNINKMNTKKLISLISNRFNNCSPNFINNLSNSFKKISLYIESLDFSNYLIDQKAYCNAEQLKDSQFDEITQLIADFERQNVNEISRQQNQEIQQLQKLNLIFQNKSNLCCKEFIDNFDEVSKRYPQTIHNLLLRQNIFVENRDKPIDFLNIDLEQLLKIEILVKKISELSLQYGDQFKNSTSPNIQFQYNSYQLRNFNKIFNDNQQISKLLVDYPIFELLDRIYIPNQIQLDFMKSTLDQSDELILERNGLGNVVIKQQKSIYGQIYTSKSLDPKINYVIRCKINKKLKCDKCGIGFGVLTTSQMKTNYITNENCCFYSNNNTYGLNKILKGSNLYDVRDQIDYIEIRINIQKRIVLFSDYPEYKNVNQMDEQNMKQNQYYSFAVFYDNPGDNYNIEITDILNIKDAQMFEFE